MPSEFGAWSTVSNRSRQWRAAGVFEALLEDLIAEAAKPGEVELSLVSIDSTTLVQPGQVDDQAAVVGGPRADPMAPAAHGERKARRPAVGEGGGDVPRAAHAQYGGG
ncbi:hypothetical protein [Streptomyces sp. NBC_00162]|uniref:hypothetical protein n=1 Tax=Streptomyces sp. NBC_00162 TaxID=2903629 RepID=UPI003A4C704A